MKKKNNMLALLGIVVVLCSMLLVALPATAIAAEQDDYVLGIYGNANEDDTIDMRDLTYVKLIFFGKKPETELADAKYDGKINPLDFIQIKLIIVGKEKELTLVDSADRIVTVKKPIERIVTISITSAELLRSFDAADKIVGVQTRINKDEVFFPELSKLPSVGGWFNPDIEAILSLEPDIVIDYPSTSFKLEDKLKGTGITVIGVGCKEPEPMMEEIERLGYVLDRRNEAKELIDFYESYLNPIKEQVDKFSENEKPQVYIEYGSKYKSASSINKLHKLCMISGGINIAADLTDGSFPVVDPEWVVEQNPDVIIRYTWDAHSSCGYDEDDSTEIINLRTEIMSRPELQHVNAVKDKRVYEITSEIASPPCIHVGNMYFAKWFHPDLFKDIDPKAAHQEYLTRFQRLDYDLDKHGVHGVFVYPEEPV
jgi:iron complex transport system substrate-binding protein